MNADGSGRRRVTSGPANEEEPCGPPMARACSTRQTKTAAVTSTVSGSIRAVSTGSPGSSSARAYHAEAPRLMALCVAFAAQTLRIGQFWDFQVHVLDVARGTTPGACGDERGLLA